MKKIAALLAVLLPLCACSGTSGQRGRTVATLPGAAGTAMPREVVFAVEKNTDRYIIEAAESFCRKANSLLQGSFTLTVSEVNGGPLAELKNGPAQFILLNGRSAASVHSFFAIANESFRYSGYENFSMSCNRAAVLERLSKASGEKVLGAYYTGSNVLAAQSPIDSLLAHSRKPDDLPERQTKLYAIKGSSAAQLPALTGLTVSELPETPLRIEALSDPDVISELSIPELVAFEPTEALPEAVGESIENVVITRSFHSIEPLWLISSQSFYDGLTDAEQSVIAEAAAVMHSLIDAVCLNQEELQLGALGSISEKDVTISSSFSSTRVKLLRSRQETLAGASPEEKHFRGILGKIQ